MDNVRVPGSQPGIEALGPPRAHQALSFIARWQRGNRVPQDRHTLVRGAFVASSSGSWRRDGDLVSVGLQTATELEYINLCAADALGQVPAEQMSDPHLRITQMTQPPHRRPTTFRLR